MGIYIPGMKMPKDGKVFLVDPWGNVRLYWSKDVVAVGTGLHLCKASELPPHGRMGDMDALMAEFERMQKLNDTRGHEFACSFMSMGGEISTEWYCVEDAVNAAKTIIPAEGGTNG